MAEEKKVVIVTGASQGIGAALVEGYRARGYNVVANSRNIPSSDAADLVAIPGDVADPATAERVVAAAIERFGRIDSLVNNAGIFIAKAFTDYNAADFQAILGTNLAGFYHVTQRVIPEMVKRGSGHIVSITTSLVDQPIKGVPSVLASLTKGGINAATRSLAIEYADQGIRVNAVSPGIIKTPMNEKLDRNFLATLHPVGRMGEIADIVDGVLYLEQSRFVTGEILHVDGGQSAGHW